MCNWTGRRVQLHAGFQHGTEKVGEKRQEHKQWTGKRKIGPRATGSTGDWAERLALRWRVLRWPGPCWCHFDRRTLLICGLFQKRSSAIFARDEMSLVVLCTVYRCTSWALCVSCQGSQALGCASGDMSVVTGLQIRAETCMLPSGGYAEYDTGQNITGYLVRVFQKSCSLLVCLDHVSAGDTEHSVGTA